MVPSLCEQQSELSEALASSIGLSASCSLLGAEILETLPALN
jgi:hypothetical protein